MSIAKFKNKDEYSEVNTQLQFMFDTGLHKKSNAYDAFGGLNAK